MSHFALLVATPNAERETLNAALQPFHEFECTGVVDQYVVDVDDTEEKREEYLKGTEWKLRAQDGSLHCPYSRDFYREPTPEELQKIGPMAGSGFGGGISYASRDWGDGEGYRPKVRYIPEGYEEVKIRTSEFQSFADYLKEDTGREAIAPGEPIDILGEHKYGYVMVDENGEVLKTIDRTNPNAEWDWWVIGGRYSERLIKKSGRRVDQCFKHELDLQAMKILKVSMRKEGVDKVYADIRDKHGLSTEEITALWVEFCAMHESLGVRWEAEGGGKRKWDWMREESAEFARLCDMGIVNIGPFGFDGADVPVSDADPYEWVEKAAAVSCFAFLTLDGQWHEKGDMGMWGMAYGEKEPYDWEREVQDWFDSLPDDAYLSMVDCHI